MAPTGRQNRVIPDSLRIILNQYLRKSEVKSLAPDGSPCTGETHGLLQRARIVAGRVTPTGKETDRRWEQGEDPSMLEFEILEYTKRGRLVVAEARDRKKWVKLGVRRLMRATNLTQKTVYSILSGKGVRPQTMATFRAAADSMTA